MIFFSVKIHAFRVKNFDMLKNEILKKQIKNTRFWCMKNDELQKAPNFKMLKM